MLAHKTEGGIEPRGSSSYTHSQTLAASDSKPNLTSIQRTLTRARKLLVIHPLVSSEFASFVLIKALRDEPVLLKELL